jgi:hypothetical protein
MARYVRLESGDIVSSTTKVTSGYFTGGVGALAGSNLVTSSLGASEKKYYYNLQYSSEDQFSVTYGHKGGSGSDNVTNVVGETEAVYRQYANMLLSPDEVVDDSTDGAFKFDGTNVDNDIYILAGERARYKDRINKKNWTLQLSGSNSASVGTSLNLTDDSETVTATATRVGPRYNVVAGTAGTVTTAASTTNYGYFYPNVGLVVLSAKQLSASIPGPPAVKPSGSTEGIILLSGLAPDLRNTGAADNAFKIFQSINKGADTSFRSEEDQLSTSFFCRAKATEFNYSNNPTFTSGSEGELAVASYKGNPQSFITTVGLYNDNQELLAVGKLSSPVQKNYSTEATIKVTLTF